MQEMKIIIKDGQMRFVYSDALQGLMEQGKTTVRRASHVEPCEGGWSADLSPVNGPVLGPFKKRQTALDAEVEWLKEHNTPVPEAANA